MPIKVKWNALERFISSYAARWRGQEGPGDTNPSLTRALFREQTKPWTRIVESHTSAVWQAIETFVKLALHYYVHKSIRDGVEETIVRPALEILQHELEQKCTEIVYDFRDIHPAQLTSLVDRTKLEESSRQTSERLQNSTEPLDKSTVSGGRTWSFLTGLPFQSRLVSAARSWELSDNCLKVSIPLPQNNENLLDESRATPLLTELKRHAQRA